MEDTEQTTLAGDGGATNSEEGRPVILPSPNTQAVGGQTVGLPSTFIAPPPVAGAVDDDLAARIESALAQDGRFSSFVSGLTLTADADGQVHLSGRVPSEPQRQSLISTISGLAGVNGVQDDLTVE